MLTEQDVIRILRNAVLKALPLAATLSLGCSNGPLCFESTSEQKNDIAINFTMKLNPGTELATLEDCIKRCQELIQKKESNLQFSKVEDFQSDRCQVLKDAEGAPVIDCDAKFTRVTTSTQFNGFGCPTPGRMPAGLSIHKDDEADAIGLYFAEMASLEAAAVTAFQYLARELQAYNAPSSFVERALQAADEEVEHAEMTALLSQAYGANPWHISVEPFALRPIDEIALENAVEGCVRETFASACALWQSAHAKEESTRLVLQRIALEESEHAALSWEIDRWLMPQLTDTQRQRCHQAKLDAITDLERSFSREAPELIREAVGLPTPDDSARLFRELRDNLWV